MILRLTTGMLLLSSFNCSWNDDDDDDKDDKEYIYIEAQGDQLCAPQDSTVTCDLDQLII